MNRYDAHVLSVDPGHTVGWVIGMGSMVLVQCQSDWKEFLNVIRLYSHSEIDRVLIERFDLRQFTRSAYETVEIIGALKFIARTKSWPLAEVNASDKKKYLEEAKRKIVDMPHAADAEAIRLYDLVHGKW